MLRTILALLLISLSALTSLSVSAEDKPKLILLKVKGEGIDNAVRANIRVAIEQALNDRYEVYSGSQVDDKIEREFVKQCRIYYDDAEMANSECMKNVAGFFIADYIATPQISAQAGGYLMTLEVRDAYTSQSVDPYSGNCADCDTLQLADAFRAMIAGQNSTGASAPIFASSNLPGLSVGSAGVVDLTVPIKVQDRDQRAVLILETNPPGAEVWLGNIRAGTTPYQNLDLVSGQDLDIVLRVPDYRDLPVKLTLLPGRNAPDTFELTPAFGSLSITSEPSGADLYIGN